MGLLGDPVHEQVEEIVENHHGVPGARACLTIRSSALLASYAEVFQS
jgi:hypothetical protein